MAVNRINTDRSSNPAGETQVHPARAMRVSDVAVNGLLVKTNAGQMLTLRISNKGAGDKVIQILDTPKVPATGAVPVFQFNLAAGQAYVENVPLDFSDGLYIAGSSSEDTFTLDAALELSICVSVR